MKRRAFLQTLALTPAALAAGPQGDDLSRKFEALRATDPVAALKFLGQTPGEPSQKLARPMIARQITQDVAAGLKGFADGKGDLAELPFTRAALLADLYAPDFSRQLMRLVFLLKQPRKILTGCSTCKGLGGAPCTACQAGLSLGPCTLCEAKGSIPCPLCDGSGSLEHRGYKGSLVIVADHEVTVMFTNDKGKSVRARLSPQTLTYQMSPCSGGSFSLQTESVVTKTGAKTTGSATQPCSKFWSEMKMFVFSGKTKIKVNNNKGQLTSISGAGARRFLADYETCAGGHVPCDRCAGKKTESCAVCQGRGKAMVPCDKCEGAAMIACPTCKGFGESTWIASVLPPAAASALSKVLADQAVILKAWTDDRQRRANRQLDLTRRREDAKKGLDPTAKLTADYVDVVCPRCKGNGTECEDCWSAGRREYYEGTAQYERYALVEKLTRQLDELAKSPAAPPALGPLPESESAAPLAQNPAARPASPAPALPAGAPPAGLALPKTVEEMIKKADEFHESAKTHLEKSKSTSDNATWIDEGVKALSDFKNAQILYTAAQEKIDDSGGTVPRTLLDKFRTNMQGLVMARKQVP
ncbi:MAG TPA: hypothetical protein VKW04_07235 [Planctomycetota bacterium]|nr:hypothetical protein [Planctomycetota bacterium]